MAAKKPLVIYDGYYGQLLDTDILDAHIDASNILNFEEYAQDAVALALTTSSTISWTYDDVNNVITADIVSESITNDHIAFDAAIAWSKIDKTGSNLAELSIRNHNDLQNIQGGILDEYYHLSSNQFTLLTGSVDASSLHNHDSLYYTQTQLQTAGEAQVDWNNLINIPTTFPPDPHTHTSTDIVDWTEAVQDTVGEFVQNSNTISWIYDDLNNVISVNVVYQSSSTISLSEDAAGLKADIVLASITNEHISATAAIAWSKIDKSGSSINDFDDVVISTPVTGQAITFDGTKWINQTIVLPSDLDAHRTAIPIDHPDGSITASKLATNIDASGIGFNADKVDGADLNDLGTDSLSLWSAAKIISYVQGYINALDWQESVLDKDLTSPPLTPSDGDRYIVAANQPAGTATGDWLGHENEIAQWDSTNSVWIFTIPDEATTVFVEDEQATYRFSASVGQWYIISAGGGVASHEALVDLYGGAPNDHWHFTQIEHDTLVTGVDASVLHNHDSLYYTQTQLQTAGQAQVDWGNLINIPTTFPPDPHTHTSTDITDWTEAVQDTVGEFVTNTPRIAWTYDDVNNLLSADIVLGSIDWDQLAFDLVPWARVDKTGSKLSDIDDVDCTPTTNSILVFDGTNWQCSKNIIISKIRTECRGAIPQLEPGIVGAYTYLDGFSFIKQSLMPIKTYQITSLISFDTLDQGNLYGGTWYALFLVNNSGTIEGRLAILARVNSETDLGTGAIRITLGEHFNPSTAMDITVLNWTVNNYANTPGQFYILSGAGRGVSGQVIGNSTVDDGSAYIDIVYTAGVLAQGDWILISPQGFSEFKLVGSDLYWTGTWQKYIETERGISIIGLPTLWSGIANNPREIDPVVCISPLAMVMTDVTIVSSLSSWEVSFYYDDGVTLLRHAANYYDEEEELSTIPLNENKKFFIETNTRVTVSVGGWC